VRPVPPPTCQQPTHDDHCRQPRQSHADGAGRLRHVQSHRDHEQADPGWSNNCPPVAPRDGSHHASLTGPLLDVLGDDRQNVRRDRNRPLARLDFGSFSNFTPDSRSSAQARSTHTVPAARSTLFACSPQISPRRSPHQAVRATAARYRGVMASMSAVTSAGVATDCSADFTRSQRPLIRQGPLDGLIGNGILQHCAEEIVQHCAEEPVRPSDRRPSIRASATVNRRGGRQLGRRGWMAGRTGAASARTRMEAPPQPSPTVYAVAATRRRAIRVR
jgi:hypothetical protein